MNELCIVMHSDATRQRTPRKLTKKYSLRATTGVLKIRVSEFNRGAQRRQTREAVHSAPGHHPKQVLAGISLIHLAGVSVPEERSRSTKGSARSLEPRELK